MAKQGDAHLSPSALQGVGAPGITSAMLAAGVHVIAEEWGICGVDIAPDLARDVFKAMTMVKRKLEFEPDAWLRFERALDVVAKSPPQHRKKKSKPRKRKRKPGK